MLEEEAIGSLSLSPSRKVRANQEIFSPKTKRNKKKERQEGRKERWKEEMIVKIMSVYGNTLKERRQSSCGIQSYTSQFSDFSVHKESLRFFLLLSLPFLQRQCVCMWASVHATCPHLSFVCGNSGQVIQCAQIAGIGSGTKKTQACITH